MNINWRGAAENPVVLGAGGGGHCSANSGRARASVGRYDHLGGVRDALRQAVMNPVIVVSVVVSLWGIINDPTTKGLMTAHRPCFTTNRRRKQMSVKGIDVSNTRKRLTGQR